ncbi:phosphate signaling complex protein PhoU [Bacillus suaedae]|uniref:Phosphate-specific transport system accessory protein PhoU n=1 Tax=Halalkalibacter suaedae TaxID=2822140 RepID=A0A941AMU9_9BACI|nr:phosphate signaling complex protein PhoU [Bacillus suaedae]MBP3949617.1 phosphate signaling complex protein PhoU [Bacillus suaedae]
MTVRLSFDSQLNTVKQRILEMGRQVEGVLLTVIDSWNSTNTAMMEKVITEDYKINQLELHMHDQVTLIISKQQPVATDLRKLIVALKISSDLERVADLAVDMAKQAKRMNSNAHLTYQDHIVTMFGMAQVMVNQALEAYEKTDLLMAQKIATMDDKVDHLYGEFIRELFSNKDLNMEVDQVTQLAFIGRYIERIADYATNIAEWVVYEVNGKHFDLN